MQVKDKIFPYPILNHNRVISNFGEDDFIFCFTPEETERYYILKDAKFETECKLINDLYDEGKLKINCVVECSYTVFRKTFELTKEPKNIKLSKADFLEKTYFSIFATAKENFTFKTDSVDEDYAGIDFEIEKYDILAANDGFFTTFIHQKEADNMAHSIFSIVASHDMEAGESYIVECDTSKKITITMSDDEYKNYKIIYTIPTYTEVFFNMLLVPSLVEGLSLCKKHLEGDPTIDLDDVGNKYLWFRSILNGYKRIYGTDLTVDDFKSASLIKLAQDLLGKPLASSLKKLVEETKSNKDGDDSE